VPHERESLWIIAEELGALVDEVGELVEILTPPPAASTIVFTNLQGVPMSSVSLTGTQTVDVAVAVGDVNGDVIAGDALDAGSGSVTVDDSSVCTAAFTDSTQSTILVTALDTNGTANVTVAGTFNGATLTDFGGPLVVTTTASAEVASTIVLTPGTPQGS
jgi:hypothetical protein